MKKERKFSDYKSEAEAWITLATGEYYPDILPDACRLYEPVLVEFGLLLKASHSSTNFFTSIMETRNQWMRTQLCRVFKKYVSPQTPVEMLKRKTEAEKICALLFLPGAIAYAIVWLWYLYRCIRGWLRFNSNRPAKITFSV